MRIKRDTGTARRRTLAAQRFPDWRRFLFSSVARLKPRAEYSSDFAGGSAKPRIRPCSAASLVVHGEDLEEDLAVLFRIVRSGHQHAEDGSADEDERLAPPPFAEPSERLPVVRLALLVRLSGEAGDGELGFDESGHWETG